MIKIKNFNKFIFLAIILIVFYAILVAFVFGRLFSDNSSFNNNSGGAPTPTRAEIYQDLDKAPFHTNSMIVLPEDKDRLQKEGILGNLIKKLPYDGKYFSLDYDYENDSFNLSIDAGNRLIAEEELKLFLNLNKISGKEVLQNLNTSSR
jgi:hypothetical protein